MAAEVEELLQSTVTIPSLRGGSVDFRSDPDRNWNIDVYFSPVRGYEIALNEFYLFKVMAELRTHTTSNHFGEPRNFEGYSRHFDHGGARSRGRAFFRTHFLTVTMHGTTPASRKPGRFYFEKDSFENGTSSYRMEWPKSARVPISYGSSMIRDVAELARNGY